MLKHLHILLIVIIVPLLLFSCGNDKKRIGVSQCSTGIWRQQMNGELKREAMLYEDIELTILTSDDDVEEQARQIETLINDGVDMLIVSPKNSHGLNSVLEKAQKKGIKVILIDRKTDKNLYDAYIGGDNEEVGRLAAEYIAKMVHGQKVVELQGDVEMTPVQDRHRGFVGAMETHGIKTQSYNCQWKRDCCQHVVDSLLRNTSDNYIFFCHNDGMAYDVVLKARELNSEDRIQLVGVDALCGDGIDMIDRREMVASVRYPTGGTEAMRAAIDILKDWDEAKKKKPGDNITLGGPNALLIAPFIVDTTNAGIMRTQDEKILLLANDNETLGKQLDGERRQLSRITPMFIGSATVAVMLLILTIYYYRKYRNNLRLRKETEEQLQKYLKDRLELLPVVETACQPLDSDFVRQLQESLSARLSDANATADDIAADLMMGRSQFYNRVKEQTGYSPKEMLRIARLKQAALLLEQTNHTVQEVCFMVGFSTPSYFAKCFKEYHGELPREYQQRNGDTQEQTK